MNNYRLIDFDIKKAKTPNNPNGLEVVTKHSYPVTILSTNYRSVQTDSDGNCRYPILAVFHGLCLDRTVCYDTNGCSDENSEFDLCLKEPIAQRRMTNRELSKWLRDCPEEYREVKGHYKNNGSAICSYYSYYEDYAEEPVVESAMIRSNYGEWHEPLVEEEDFEL